MELFSTPDRQADRRRFVLATLLVAPQLFGMTMAWEAIDRISLAVGCYMAGVAIGLVVAVFALIVCGFASDALQLIGLDENEET